MNESVVACPAVLALELADGEKLQQLTLTRDEAQTLAALIADDLRGLLPGVEDARLAVVGALFDAVELLRPGFPLYATLDELARRVPRVTGTSGVIAFGTHEGHMPAEPLTPEPVYADGPMRLLPWTLLAPADLAESLSEQMEIALVGRGEAGAATSDFLMRTLGVRLEHARYLSRDDLLALTCVQYEHVNLAPMWTLLEAALLTPYREETALGARGLPMRYAEGKVHVAAPATWFARSGDRQGDPAHEFAGVMFELRQYAAVLGAHRLPLVMDGDNGDIGAGFLLENIAAMDPGLDAPALFAHEAPGLGVVAVTVAQSRPGHAHVLAHAYPLSAQALGPMVAALADRYPSADDLNMLGMVLLAEGNRLSAPPGSSLH